MTPRTRGYNALGELTSITDPLNHVTTLAYFPSGLIQTITDAQSHVTTYGYDTHGNRTSVTDALNHQTTFAYDTGDRLKTITYPDTTTTTFVYDTRGRRTELSPSSACQVGTTSSEHYPVPETTESKLWILWLSVQIAYAKSCTLRGLAHSLDWFAYPIR